MSVEAEISKIVKGREVEFTIYGENVGVLIGKRGNTLNSLQYLTKLVANRNTKQYIGITLDVENYRSKRKATLEALSYRLAKQVVSTKKELCWSLCHLLNERLSTKHYLIIKISLQLLKEKNHIDML